MRELLEGQVRHISKLVDDLLDVSRVSTGKLRVERQHVDMIEILNNAIGACSPVMTAKRQHFETHVPSGVLFVNGDPARLTQILGNLLANAAKYTPAGGKIALAATVEADVMRISISDSGIGISAKVLPFIFDPYVQDEHAIGFNGSGLGIGLTVVRELVEAHGGKAVGMSEGSGKGSEFVVTLPLVSAG